MDIYGNSHASFSLALHTGENRDFCIAVKIHSDIVNIIPYVVKLIILFQDTWKIELDFVCLFFFLFLFRH